MLIRYLPEFMRGFTEIREIMKAEDSEFEQADSAVRKCLDDSFVMHSSGGGLRRWEQLFGINARGGDSEEERRLVVLSRLSEMLPYNLSALERALFVLCGNDFTLSVTGFVVTVRLKLQVQGMISAVEQLLNRYVPANMVIDLDLIYNTYSVLNRFRHSQFRSHTHENLRREIL